MEISKREFLKRLGAGGVALAGGIAFGDEGDGKKIAEVTGEGDPFYPNCNKIHTIPHMPTDVASATLQGGKVVQPAREVPVFHETDVAVVGGGPAGYAAAVASARTGAKTALIERYGSLGGLFSNGMVLILVGSGDIRPGHCELVTRGLMEDLIEKAKALGPHAYYTDERHTVTQPTIGAEAIKVIMDRTCRAERNLEVFFHAWGVDVIQTGNAVRGVVFESKQGRQAILAKRVIDCTGDGDVFFQAGANYRQISHSIGYVYQIGGLDSVPREAAMSREARLAYFPVGRNQPLPGAFWSNNGGQVGNGLDIRTLTAVEFEMREKAWTQTDRMRQTPGYEKTFLMNTCSQIGVRATRLLEAEHVLTKAEAEAETKFDDAIGMSGDDCRKRPPFQIPYRALVPKGLENLLVAGRCAGYTPDLIDRTRLIPVCVVTGQAAGTAAALSVLSDKAVRDIDTTHLRRQLVKDGVYIA